MSHFDDDIDRDIGVIAERVSPSPDAWASIQQRIADRQPEQETEIIMLTENTLTKRRWPLVAAAAAVAALAVGAIAVVNRDDGAEQPADLPEPVPTVAPAPDGADEQAADGASMLPREGQTVPPGRYSVDSLGVPIEFDVPDLRAEWKVDINTPLAFSISTDAGFLGMQRIGSFHDAVQAQNPDEPGLGNIPPDDVDRWIEDNEVIVDASNETTLSGRAAQFRQVRVPPGSGEELCPVDAQPCIRVNTVSADAIATNPGGGSQISGDSANAYWFIELDDFEPVGIWAFAFDGDITAWLDEIAPLIDSMTLGEPGPAVDGGIARLPERQQFFASYSGSRSVGAELEDGTREVTGRNTVEGDLTGEIVATGIEVTPANGFDDLVFTGTIEGLGTGTLTMYQEWTGAANGDIAPTTFVISGTDDFTGFTGQVFTSVEVPDESGPEPVYSGRMTFELVIPRSG